MASDLEVRMWVRLDEAKAERDALFAQVAPLEKEKEWACLQRQQLNDRSEALAKQINAIMFPKMKELSAEISLISKALSGKTRPA
jgi:hypothetical protein